jgi:oligosaccharide repeat unit polymerase
MQLPCAQRNRQSTLCCVNLARALAALLSLGLASVAHRHYRTLLNPVSALTVPLGVALLLEEVFIPSAPFGLRAAAFLLSSEATFTLGALAGRVGRVPARILVRLKGGVTYQRAILVAILLSCVGLVMGARFVRGAYDATGVGYVRPGVFDRSLVIATIAGSKADYIIRAIIFAVFPVGAVIALYWLARGRLRLLATLFYALGVSLISIALRARLNAVLATTLFLVLLFLASGAKRHSYRAVVVVAIAVVAVAGLFNEVAHQRYGAAGSARGPGEFIYSTVGGPSALSVALSQDQPVSLLSNEHHSRGQSLAGLLSLVGRQRGLGSYTPVSVGPTESASLNIFTGAWLLKWDVGVPFTLLIMFLLGVLSRYAFRYFISRGTAGSMLATANLLFLLVCFPVSLLSTYNFWWSTFLLVPVVNRVFRLELEYAELSDGATEVPAAVPS